MKVANIDVNITITRWREFNFFSPFISPWTTNEHIFCVKNVNYFVTIKFLCKKHFLPSFNHDQKEDKFSVISKEKLWRGKNLLSWLVTWSNEYTTPSTIQLHNPAKTLTKVLFGHQYANLYHYVLSLIFN